MNKIKGFSIVGGIGIAALIALLIVLLPKLQVSKESKSLGSVTVGNEYSLATTTRPGAGPALLRAGSGSLGNITVTASSSGSYVLYDASTTNVNLRTGATATNSLPIVGQIDVYTPPNTYTFDVNFTNGLIFVPSGTLGTTTIGAR